MTKYTRLADALTNPENVTELDLTLSDRNIEFDTTMVGISRFTKLTCLRICEYNSPISVFHALRPFTSLKTIRYIYLNFNYNKEVFQEDVEILQSFPYLRVLSLTNHNFTLSPKKGDCHFPDIFASFPLLQQLTLENCDFIQTLPSGLNLLHNLTHFSLISRYGRLHTLPFKKGALPCLTHLSLAYSQSLDFEEELQKFNPKTLEELDLMACRMTELPACLFKFTQLKKLNLAYNKVKKLPLEISQLKKLERIDTSKNDFARNSAIKGGSIIPKIMQFSCQLNLSESDLTLYFALLTENIHYLDRTPKNDLLKTLNAPFTAIRLQALTVLEKFIESPFTKEFDKEKTVLCLLGSVAGMVTKDIYRQLQAHGISISKKISSEVTHVIVGEQPGEKLALLHDFEVVLALPVHLKKFLQTLDIPYLMGNSKETATLIQKMEELLRSDEPVNIQLGMNMMLEGGTPEYLLYMVMLISIDQTGSTSKLARKIIEKYAATEIKSILQKHGRKEVTRAIDALHREPLLHQPTLLKAGLCYFSPTGYRYAHQKVFQLAIRYDHDTALQAVRYKIQSQRLDLSYLSLRKIPDQIETFTQLQEIDMRYNYIQKIPRWLKEFKELKKLHLKGNWIKKNQEEIIKKLLPQVEIQF